MTIVTEKTFECKGFPCVITFNSLGFRCGYVGVDKNHPLYGASENSDMGNSLSCHGGITYAGERFNDGLWYFGFDCGHYGDGMDYDLAIKHFPENAQAYILQKQVEEMFPTGFPARSLAYVENECKQLALQIRALSEKLTANAEYSMTFR